jgi:hypothetical protein
MPNGKIDTSPSTKLTGWRKLADDTIAGIVGTMEGAIGMDPTGIGVGPSTNKLTQLLMAGLPLTKITRGRSLFHGTPNVFKRFDPSKANPQGSLSNLINAAEEPGYANMYAGGLSQVATKQKLPQIMRQNIIPLSPTAKNVLDLANPNLDDISHIMGNLHPYTRKTLLDDYKMNLQYPNELEEGITPLQKLAYNIQDALDEDEKAIGRTLFDAVRYETPGGPSVGFVPGRAPLRTPWGIDLSPSPKISEGPVGIGKRFPKFISPKRK